MMKHLKKLPLMGRPDMALNMLLLSRDLNMLVLSRIPMSRYFCSVKDAFCSLADSDDEVQFIKDSNNDILIQFWDYYYSYINTDKYKRSNVKEYQHTVFDLLNKKKSAPFSEDELHSLQIEIEDLSMTFSEKRNLHECAPNLIKRLIRKDKPTAKEYLKSSLKPKYLSILHHFGSFTLEAIIIHVLGLVYTSHFCDAVKVATLIDQLNDFIYYQAKILESNKCSKDEDPRSDDIKKKKNYDIGAHLVMFLEERELILLKNDMMDSYTPVSPKKGMGYFKKSCYAICNLDLSLLPLKLNLPMVYKPLSWASNVSKPSTLSEMFGGYLCTPTAEIYNRFRLLSSRDLSSFYIKLHNPESKRMCEILSRLQSQPFEINKKVLTFILNNRDSLVKFGLLMPKNLVYVSLQEASDLLRFCYVNFEGKEELKKLCSLDFLLMELTKRLQCARYEDFVLRLASAYDGYRFYLPAFIDFRGRIYRSGILNFHERDLARSLIVFSSKASGECTEKDLRELACAAAFKYKKFYDFESAQSWYTEHENLMSSRDDSFISFAAKASDPFQFISKVLDKDVISYSNILPLTQDASASAYQIMSYLLLDDEMARRTNLIPSPDKKIQDMYIFLLEELKHFLKEHLDTKKYTIIESMLARKLVKALFMPLIYGKTVFCMAHDIGAAYGSLLNRKDCYNLAALCYEFWKEKYPNIVNLINLLSLVGWFCSVLDKHVCFSIKYFTTVQDYMCKNKVHIWLYDRMHKKRKRRVTLLVPSTKRDRRKTRVATCVNFIHQKDAFIAMKVVKDFLDICEKAPIYTVHDNFLTTTKHASDLPGIYTKVFSSMGAPLHLINEFLYLNLIKKDFPYYMDLSEECPKILNSVGGDIRDWLYKDPKPDYYHWVYNPIPNDHLKYILSNLEACKNMSPKDMSNWESKIDDIVSCYEIYVKKVCGEAHPEDGGMLHTEKWNEFQSLLESWGDLGYNYSIHY